MIKPASNFQDYIFVSKDIKVENTYVADEVGSDHKMIVAELVFNEQ